jgi:hypothetical protein
VSELEQKPLSLSEARQKALAITHEACARRAEAAERDPDQAACPECAKLELALREIHDRAHSWNNIPACSDIERMAFDALGLERGK